MRAVGDVQLEIRHNPHRQGIGRPLPDREDYDPTTGGGNGFEFFEYSPEAFWDSIMRAKKVFADAQAWKALMQRAMESDFSWATASEKYGQVYEKLLPKTAARSA